MRVYFQVAVCCVRSPCESKLALTRDKSWGLGQYHYFCCPSFADRYKWLETFQILTEDNESKSVRFHNGIQKNGKWSCCGEEVGRTRGCVLTKFGKVQQQHLTDPGAAGQDIRQPLGGPRYR